MKLDRTVVCSETDCQEVWCVTERQDCPSCGSTTYFLIAKALNRERLRFESERTIHELEDWPIADRGRLMEG